ncbi:MAG: glycosyltransferase [Prolixibacteraceae bacterium]|jgi:glycosyltransferase involved in cell wall biosynthesis|nr:glycosyltransferase [Prolixibacteraceae bacterium]
MRVLLLIKRFQYGGAENYVSELANALADAGHSVWVMSMAGNQQLRLRPAVQHIAVDFSDLKIPFHLYRLIKLIKAEKIEVIHAHQRLPILLGTIAAKWMKILVVATIHGSVLTDLRSDYARRNIDKAIAIRESCISCITNCLGSPGKVVLIPNGVHMPAVCVDRFVDPGSFSIYYISRMDRHHTRLLAMILTEVWPRLLEKYPRSHLHVVGDGFCLPSITRVLKQANFSSLCKTVHFEGYAREVGDHYPGADLVMGVGRVAIESLIHGVPLLSVKHNHLGPIVTVRNLKRMQYANFVDLEASAPDAHHLLEKLISFLEHRIFYENEAKILQQRVSQEYNLNNVAERIVAVYREVTDSQGFQNLEGLKIATTGSSASLSPPTLPVPSHF